MKLSNISGAGKYLAVLAVIAIMAGSATQTAAQQYTVVPGYYGQEGNTTNSYPDPIGYYYYQYNYPVYRYFYGLYGWYDYYSPAYNEWIVTAQDMKAADLCAGPIDAMSLMFLRNAKLWNSRVRIFMRHTTLTSLGQFTRNGNGIFNYAHAARRIGTNNIVAASGATEVYDNPNWSMPIIPYTAGVFPAVGETVYENGTWIDFEFNKSTFVWDGNSNIIIGMLRCDNTSGYSFQWAEMVHTYVNPPSPGFSYGPYWTGHDLKIFNNSCDNMRYRRQNVMFAYQYAQGFYGRAYYRPLVRLRVGAGVSQSYPDDVDPRRILRNGEVYDGSAGFPKPSLTFYGQAGKTVQINYRILAPNGSTVYQATSGGNSTISVTPTSDGPMTYTVSEATGTFAGSNGALDLTNGTGGGYRVDVEFTSDCGTAFWRKQFIIANAWDVTLALIRSPQEVPKKNPVNVTLPLSAQIQNVGLNDITDVDVRAIVKGPNGATLYDEDVKWTGNLSTGDRAVVDINFVPFIPTEVGLYTVEMCATLNDEVDQGPDNDCLPEAGDDYVVSVNYNEEAGMASIQVPSSSGNYFANRPFRAMGTVENGGILDLSDVPVRLTISNAQGQQVYNERVIVQSVDAAAPNNFAFVDFPLFTPPAAGTYTACMTVEYPGDPDNTNNQVCTTFDVQGNLEGTYTIGLLNQNKPKNYETFDAAINDLYLKGVSGPVTFELTDAAYELFGNPGTNNVALDLSGHVVGMNATNTITFKPSLQRALSKGSITITLNSPNGIGVLFGQQLTPSNPNSLAQEFPNVRPYSNSAGYYTFDGGNQKSIKVQLSATTPFRAPFYLGDGSSNITLKNLVIDNAAGSNASYTTSLPRTFYTNGQFSYENDVRSVNGQPVTYSAGIVSRAKLPVGISGNNAERLDTLTNSMNVVSGNEIRGFGYGIVDLGIGQLIKGGVNTFTAYHNLGNRITNNVISNVARAGVYAAYNEGLMITHNEIYNVGSAVGSTQTMASGITLGGGFEGRYYNGAVTASYNEIHGITGTQYSWGIEVNQARVRYQGIGGSGLTDFAGGASYIGSNVVWDLKRGSSSGTAAGIHLLTRRGANLFDASDKTYFTMGDTVANNTVVMGSDNVTGDGAVVGIGIQNANGAVVMNNAIALTVPANAAPVRSALLYEGTLFAASGSNDWYLGTDAPASLVSNNNAFYTPNAGIARFVEISGSSEVVSLGSQTELENLSQWQTWTGQDLSSVEGDFVAEHELQGVAPRQHLRVKVTPQPPIGSILNDRGERITSLTMDVDGQTRGAAGQGYDIGADEFDGRLYVSDLEVVEILSPSSYRSSTGATSDAEYVMTEAPVDVTARVRNSGALPRTNADVTVMIYRETMASNNGGFAMPAWEATPVAEGTVQVDLNSGVSTDVAFGLVDFAPQSYEQLAGYTVPARFAAMELNVTPRYRAVVMVGNDENNANNMAEKTYRFFIKRSLMSIVMSTENAGTALTAQSGSTEIAGRLNADSLQAAFADLGFINDAAGNMLSYDVLDRQAWEPRAVDYTIYRTMFWSDGDGALSRSERDDIRNFIDAGVPGGKKNLAIGAEDLVRAHAGSSITDDKNFVNRVLRASSVNATTPSTPNYNGKRIVGRAIARNTVETVSSTGYANDAAPMPALMSLYSDATTGGIALSAYSYMAGDRQTTDSIAGVATAALTHNTVYVGIDWRHYARAGAFTGGERVLRGVIDFFEENGGTVVPVELVSFDAKSRGTDVDVFWATASEQDADHFLVERADAGLATAGEAVYEAVATVPAAGTTTERQDYAVVDRGLQPGVYSYRLASVDRDGSVSRTGDVQVVIGGSMNVSIESVMPNPVVSQSVVTVSLPQAGMATVRLVDMAGRQVAVVHNGELPQGTSTVNLEAANLATGTYTVVIESMGLTATAPVTISR